MTNPAEALAWYEYKRRVERRNSMTTRQAICTLIDCRRLVVDGLVSVQAEPIMEAFEMAIEALKYMEAMTEREALSDIVKVIGTLTYGKERWFENNGCWYDRKECDCIQNETLVERISEALREEIDL